MRKRDGKKGFTIVELVIVIAVVAVLAAVLIPTFISIVKKANTSSDIQLVKNLNIILASEAAAEGKNATMTDALKDAEENGYSVEKLTPTNSDNEILWDSLNDCFVLMEEGETVPNYCGAAKTEPAANVNRFKIYSTERPLTVDGAGVATSDYSIYLGEGAIADTVIELKVSTGIDVGNNNTLTALTYESTAGQDVVIRTNGGTLKIDAPIDTVLHYGEVDALNITAVSPSASYHEFGRVTDEIKIVYGRFVVEKGASIPVVQIDDAANVDNITLISKGDQCIAYISDSDKATALAAKSDRFTVTNNEVFVNAVARIGDTYYTDLIEAFSAADGKTIVLLKDISFKDEGLEAKKNNWITVNEGTSVTLDLAGHVLYCKLDLNGTTAMINNKGTLTIDDSSESKTGLIEYKPGTPDASYGYASNTITNGGKLIISNGTIKNSASSAGACYAIDNNSSGSDATLNIKGGLIRGQSTAVRMFCNSTTNKNEMSVSGGIIKGNYAALWIQLPGSSAQKKLGTLNVTGGTLEGAYAFYDYSYGDVFDEMSYTISGGTFNGDVFSYGCANFTISGGTINGDVSTYGTLTVTGGNSTGGFFSKATGEWVEIS